MELIYDQTCWLEELYGLNTLWGILIGAGVAVALVSYFLGCFNGAVIVSKYILHDDVRTHGSGNAGLTNFFRTFGGPLTLAVILCDMLKAVLSVLFGVWVFTLLRATDPLSLTYIRYWAGLFCMIGHMFPFMFGFKGGKGVLSGSAIALMIDWRVGLAVWCCFMVFAVSTRYISLGSCCAAATFPIASWLIFHDPYLLLMGLLMGGIVIWKHRGNIQRLLSGTESKFTFHKKKEG